ncbi:MAG: TetR/AcrR family transcriptional regulator [Actinomycetia bacterium]|nr:TetR/AcrR family transcriptional regulator [Actinomycetes bacterium]
MTIAHSANEPTTSGSPVHDRVLDAAEQCLRRFGAADTTMEDIAETAGISRATVYRYFDGRDGVLLGVAGRDIDRYLSRLGTHLDSLADPQDALLAFCTRVIRATRRDETLALLYGQNTGTGRAAPPAGSLNMLFTRTIAFLCPYFDSWQRAGAIRPELDPRDAADWTLRMVTSLIMVPGVTRRQGADLEVFLRSFLLPALITPEIQSKTGAS